MAIVLAMAQSFPAYARLGPWDMTARPSPDSPLVARFVASPNHGERRGYSRPNCLILHYTGMPTGAAALKTLTDPASEVSAHYLIWEDGVIDQLVAENDRAWTGDAASSCWGCS